MFGQEQVQQLLETVIYSAVGVIIFALAFKAIAMLSPFSIRKEIEEDQNTALGVIIASLIIGLAIIIASAIQ